MTHGDASLWSSDVPKHNNGIVLSEPSALADTIKEFATDSKLEREVVL